ncbi:hypothetical protein [Vibrio harveyi]|uniref:hypothetical protein n=1 Tax=Vibrio harveyi TaxID=669 RepID=UPI00338DD76F
MFDKFKKAVSRDVDGDFEQGSIVNQKTSSRNMLVTTVVFILLGGLTAGIYKYTGTIGSPPKRHKHLWSLESSSNKILLKRITNPRFQLSKVNWLK